ncbi:MAG: protein-glutamate O-methyltransferase CheR [Ignavibacteria bacterium]|nr:protein-glutamate O-methyltransferase CheR [Ignavibacteria bacterium]
MSTISESLGFTTSSFELLRDLIQLKTGIYFDNGKAEYLADKIAPRLIENNLTSFLDYYYKLKYEDDSNEWKELINAITINETYFYREYPHLKVLVERIIPDYFQKFPQIPLRIWSGACSTGEEPLSIAIAINEAGYFEKYPIKIFATDLNPYSIEKAKQGLFRERSFRAFPLELREKYFTKEGNLYKIKNDILEKVDFSVKNILDFNELPFLYLSNIIFVKNVMIYFSDAVIKNFIDNLYSRMTNQSYLFIGISESLIKYHTKFELTEIDGVFLYQKK